MINERLIGYLESNNLTSEFQLGFRSERCTNDNLVRLETFIRDAFVKSMSLLYFSTWKSIKYDLAIWHTKRLQTFFQSFFEKRIMQVRLGSTLSDLFDQEQGVPQGSILSRTLINIKIQ